MSTGLILIWVRLTETKLVKEKNLKMNLLASSEPKMNLHKNKV